MGVFLIDAAGRVQSSNAAAETYLSASSTGALVAALADPSCLAAAQAGLAVQRTVPVASPGGAELTLSYTLSGPSQVVVIATPAEVHPPSAATQLGWLERVPVLLALYTSEGCCAAVSRLLATRVQQDPQELVGMRLADLVWDSHRIADPDPIILALAGEASSTLELTLRAGDDTRIAVELDTIPLSDDEGHVVGAWAVFHDVAKRFEMERELEEYTHDLEQLYLQLERRTEELEAANEATRRERTKTLEAEELARLERVRTAFMEVAAHELRTPVTLLCGTLEILRAGLANGGQDVLLAAAERSARRLGGIVNNALKLLESDRPNFEAQFKRCSLRHTLESAANDAQPFVQLRHQTLLRDVPIDLPDIVLDRSMIRDVALNLLMNAIKFTPDGGTITLQATQLDEDCLRFSVADEGVGIASEDLPHIFDSGFSSLDTRHHSSGDYEFRKRGPGLGLAIVRKFTDLHGGELQVETEPGQGTRVSVTLPRRRGATARQSRSSQADTART